MKYLIVLWLMENREILAIVNFVLIVHHLENTILKVCWAQKRVVIVQGIAYHVTRYISIEAENVGVVQPNLAEKEKLLNFIICLAISVGFVDMIDVNKQWICTTLTLQQKKFQLSIREMQYKWEKVWEEAQKCCLLCCRCHREVHYGLIDVTDIYKSKWKEIKGTVA